MYRTEKAASISSRLLLSVTLLCETAAFQLPGARLLRAGSQSPRVRAVYSQQLPAGAVKASAAALISAGFALSAANGIFGILDQTADELADLLGVDEVPPALVNGVLATRPLYEPLKAVSTSCTDAVFPEFNSVNDFNDCLLLRRRVFWRGGGRGAIVIDQTMEMGTLWKQSTGSSVWGGGVVLARYMETLGDDFWAGKSVLELGSGAGVGGITAAKLGATDVLATDRDASVLELAQRNAAINLGAQQGIVSVAQLEWGSAEARVDGTRWDMVIGADLTYNREAWPALIAQLQRLRAPAILSASERRDGELASLRAAFDAAGITYSVLDSPFTNGYAGRHCLGRAAAASSGTFPPMPACPQAREGDSTRVARRRSD